LVVIDVFAFKHLFFNARSPFCRWEKVLMVEVINVSPPSSSQSMHRQRGATSSVKCLQEIPMRLALLALTFAATLAQAQAIKVDGSLPAYKPSAGVSGQLNVVGSDTLSPIVNLWFGGFQKLHQNVIMKSTAEGSTAGVLALLEGESLIASMSREMSRSEVVAFQGKFGYPPTRIVIGLDALVVFVHTMNPIPSLTLEQLDAIYSTTRKQGGKEPITTWGALGLAGDWANRRITLCGRDENSGARGLFRDKVLLKGDFRPGVANLDEASSIIEAVSLSPSAIGYASIADVSSLVRAVPIITASGAKATPSADTILKSDYPLTYFLYLYVNKAPGKPLPPAVFSFLTYALSKEGQTSVAVTQIPIPADVSRSMWNKLQ
jgi:phosphate transport system substrate-binding protein